MLKGNLDPLPRFYGDKFDYWLKNGTGRAQPVNFRTIAGINSGVDRFTHLIHSYPAKLLLNIPQVFLNCPQLGRAGDVVLDPFCGSGTVLLEGILNGRKVEGHDANPLARLIARVKITPLAPDMLTEFLEELLASIPQRGDGLPPGSMDLAGWYSPKVLRQLDRLATAIRNLPPSRAKDFMQVCLSGVIRKVSLADPSISVPVRLNAEKCSFSAFDQQVRRGWLKERQQANAILEFAEIAKTNISRMAKLHDHLGYLRFPPSKVTPDVRATSEMKSVDLVITSPPYGSAQKYVRACSLSLQWLGLAPRGLRPLEKKIIGREHFDLQERMSEPRIVVQSSAKVLEKIGARNPLRKHIAGTYLAETHETLSATVEKMRDGAHLILVIGNNVVCGLPFDNRTFMTEICEGLGLTLNFILNDRIRSRGLITKRHGDHDAIRTESILVFRKK